MALLFQSLWIFFRAAVTTTVGPFDARQSHLYAAGRSSSRLLSCCIRVHPSFVSLEWVFQCCLSGSVPRRDRISKSYAHGKWKKLKKNYFCKIYFIFASRSIATTSHWPVLFSRSILRKISIFFFFVPIVSLTSHRCR